MGTSRFGGLAHQKPRTVRRKVGLFTYICFIWCTFTLLHTEYWVTRSSFHFRSNTPSHASWSADGSILAVSQAPHVVLYDPATCIPIKTLTCPESNNVSSAHFIGRSGRYLAAIDKRNLVLWDLVTQTGKPSSALSYSMLMFIPCSSVAPS